MINPVHIGGGIVLSSAVIRLDPDGPYLHQDVAHALIGISEVTIRDNGHLFVESSKPGPVVSVFAQPDETLGGKYGIIAGVTGGGPGSYIHLYDTRVGRKLNLHEDYSRVSGPYSNIWFEIKHFVG